ncbi:protein MNN4-like, partial [Scomber scombrus]
LNSNDSDSSADILPLTQNVSMNEDGGTTRTDHSGKIKIDKKGIVHTRRVLKFDNNVVDVLKPSSGTPGKTTPSKKDKVHKSHKSKKVGRKLSMERGKSPGAGQSGRKERPAERAPLPETIETHGRRRVLGFTPEFLAMLRLLFQEDIERQHVPKRRIREVLDSNPGFLNICNKLELSVENVRSRIRIMMMK